MLLYEELSNKVVSAFFRVHNELKGGLLEACYHNALFFELKSGGFSVGYNAPFNVYYQKQQVGEFYADLVVNNKIIIEIKSVAVLASAHESQLLNYLHISGCRVGYLVNFQGQRVVWKRFVV
ncbi:MAG: GxxExxY protein [Spirochaetales bacterium]|uniref:GxxExxY protein n=1 Tax=Candidatus Thalassospirochaeta sargassi TaxID=3119039 RepID=A0AAJ1IG72_9SPIO|nr:GxxExxY protein [Spirochaetales bacterium]